MNGLTMKKPWPSKRTSLWNCRISNASAKELRTFTILNYINLAYPRFNNNPKKEQMKSRWTLKSWKKSRKKSRKTSQLPIIKWSKNFREKSRERLWKIELLMKLMLKFNQVAKMKIHLKLRTSKLMKLNHLQDDLQRIKKMNQVRRHHQRSRWMNTWIKSVKKLKKLYRSLAV